jgi:transcription elongation factor Elf1
MSEHKTLKELASEEMRTGRDPEACRWPDEMPVRMITVRGRTQEAARRIRRGMQQSYPKERPCPICSKPALSSDLVTELFYGDDYQRCWASWISERLTHCPSCGDRHHIETVWIQKPDGWNSIPWSGPHSDLGELAPFVVALPTADPDKG